MAAKNNRGILLGMRALLIGLTITLGATMPAQARPMEWAEIAALPQPPATATIAYGPGVSQYGELRLPKTAGPFPVVVLLHGGCWSLPYGLDHVRSLAAALTAEGFATWSLEYRRLGEAGGGWPNTFLDAGHGIDFLRTVAKTHALDLNHVTLMGHSAGGHLALWAAGRCALGKASPLFLASPLPVHAVVGLAAISNLKTYAKGQGSCNEAALALLGGQPETQAARYADAQPAVPASVQVALVHGEEDPLVPFSQSQTFPHARLYPVPGAGHFDVIAPTSKAAWPVVVKALKASAR